MTSPHGDMKSDAGAYVLGSLDHDERAAFEAHLAECDECAAEVRALRGVTSALAHAVPQRTPRSELRQRALASLPGASTPPSPARWQMGAGRNLLPLAATLVLAVGVAAYAARLQTRVDDLEARLAQALVQASAADSAVADARRVGAELQSAMGVLSAPDLVRIDLAGQPAAPLATGRAQWSRARGMVFAASNLPALPAGGVYQVWVVTGPAPVSAGLLTADTLGDGLVFFSTPPDIAPPTAVAVTLEPTGGVPAPTGQFFLVGTPGATL